MDELEKLFDAYMKTRLSYPQVKRDAEEKLFRGILDEMKARRGGRPRGTFTEVVTSSKDAA